MYGRLSYILSLICIKFRQNSERKSQYSTSVECKMNLALMLGEPFPGFQGGVKVKESACRCRRCRRHRFDPGVRKIPGRGNGNSLQYSCLENCRGQRSLADYSPQCLRFRHDWACTRSAHWAISLLTELFCKWPLMENQGKRTRILNIL